jgi:N-acetylglucosamine-6-phosphate deacetylase
MPDLVLDHVRAMQPGEGIIANRVRVRAGKIVELDGAPASEADEHVDAAGHLLTPGLIDLHTHGIHQYAYESSPENIRAGAELLGRYGTTSILPTLYEVVLPGRSGELAQLASALPQVTAACMPGFHLEGPFLALPGAGIRTVPGDVKLLDEQIAAAGGRVCAVSISPDTPGILPVIERLVEAGIVPFITHTRASVEQTQAALAAGARHATHFYCVFPLPEETDAGVRPAGAVEAILADRRASVDFVADGIHAHPVTIQAAVVAKGYEGVILITDANVGAGLPEGVYDTPGGYRVRITPGDAARICDAGHPLQGGIAGSSLTMDRGIDNLLRWLDLPDEQVWAMGTSNPARLMGWSHKGVLRAGADADLVLWDRDAAGKLRALQTWVGGRCVYSLATSDIHNG